MLHSKLAVMGVGGLAAMTKSTAALNRLQFAIETGVNGSIVAPSTTYSSRRYQHALCAKPMAVQPSRVNHSILSREPSTSVSALWRVAIQFLFSVTVSFFTSIQSEHWRCPFWDFQRVVRFVRNIFIYISFRCGNHTDYVINFCNNARLFPTRLFARCGFERLNIFHQQHIHLWLTCS